LSIFSCYATVLNYNNYNIPKSPKDFKEPYGGAASVHLGSMCQQLDSKEEETKAVQDFAE